MIWAMVAPSGRRSIAITSASLLLSRGPCLDRRGWPGAARAASAGLRPARWRRAGRAGSRRAGFRPACRVRLAANARRPGRRRAAAASRRPASRSWPGWPPRRPSRPPARLRPPRRRRSRRHRPCPSLWATASGPAFGMMYASAGSSAASSGAGSAGASVTKLAGPQPSSRRCGAELGGAQPAAQQAVGGVEDVLGGKADLRGVALDRLDGVALGVGVAALVLQRAQDLRQLGEAEGISMVIGGVLSESGAATIATLLPPPPRRQCRSGPIASHEYSRRLRRAHEGVSGPIHQL